MFSAFTMHQTPTDYYGIYKYTNVPFNTYFEVTPSSPNIPPYIGDLDTGPDTMWYVGPYNSNYVGMYSLDVTA